MHLLWYDNEMAALTGGGVAASTHEPVSEAEELELSIPMEALG